MARLRQTGYNLPIMIASARCFPLFGILSFLLLSCSDPPEVVPEWGVSWELARERASRITDLSYDLSLEIPALRSDPIRGVLTASFGLDPADRPLVLDFRQDAVNVRKIQANGREAAFSAVNGHILVESARLKAGQNSVTIEFLAGDGSLNRRDDHLYTLFVPDRASVALPCFDQPDLKARYRLTLAIPAQWEALANGQVLDDQVVGDRREISFQETQPLSTYQFAFAVGRFQVEEHQMGDRIMRLFHRETNRETVERNLDAIFELHTRSLDWLEEYTAIPYPYGKFDFALLPAFQYGGMEHPGAIFYRDRGLWLDDNATLSQTMGRANVIAHETAHMWFGNLVTMRWFDDVWTKEVYANFMAAKIANPIFPEIDHELRFFLRHYPSAYAVDRTDGANPIRQPLENLIEAGTMYGPIIYQKAPIVMRQLEDLLGKEKLREGLQTYLKRFAYANGSWPELVGILDDLTDLDLTSWSRVWVEEAGRPHFEVQGQVGDSPMRDLRLSQSDPGGRDLIWSQPIQVGYRMGDERLEATFLFDEASRAIEDFIGNPAPDYILPNAGSRAYGLFRLDSRSRDYLLSNLARLKPELERAVVLQNLWENMLEGWVEPERLIAALISSLGQEENELLADQQLGLLQRLFWDFLIEEDRSAAVSSWESLLWERLETAPTDSQKSSFFSAYQSISLSPEAIERLTTIWRDRQEPGGLTLSESDFTSLAMSLVIKTNDDQILKQQLGRIKNPDRRAQLAFVGPALSPDPMTRDQFFESLADDRNRDREPWVAQALSFLNHPLRADSSIKYLRPVLELLEEIQSTGDIFFPSRWLESSFGGHSSLQAVQVVDDFLAANPDYPARLRAKIQQSTDSLRRKVRWRGH